jgi:hypothetical protein
VVLEQLVAVVEVEATLAHQLLPQREEMALLVVVVEATQTLVQVEQADSV